MLAAGDEPLELAALLADEPGTDSSAELEALDGELLHWSGGGLSRPEVLPADAVLVPLSRRGCPPPSGVALELADGWPPTACSGGRGWLCIPGPRSSREAPAAEPPCGGVTLEWLPCLLCARLVAAGPKVV